MKNMHNEGEGGGGGGEAEMTAYFAKSLSEFSSVRRQTFFVGFLTGWFPARCCKYGSRLRTYSRNVNR